MNNTNTEIVYRSWSNAVSLLVKKGIKYAVLSPGSRPAPIALSFLRNSKIKCYIHSDERSAAYMASGIAQMTSQTVCLLCTSGTAALNYAPAVAEAYFRHIPLIVITADRPAEWTGQADNQAIYQENLYGKNVKASFNMPLDLVHPDAQWFFYRNISEAVNISTSSEPGPVHINVPLREPLYLTEKISKAKINSIAFKDIELVTTEQIDPDFNFKADKFAEQLKKNEKVILAAGYLHPDPLLKKTIQKFLNSYPSVVFIPDITSNLQEIDKSCCHTDLLLKHASEKLKNELKPSLLITIGGPFVSKSLKEFLRKNKALLHWNISNSSQTIDTFQSLTHQLICSPLVFFNALSKSAVQSKNSTNFSKKWTEFDNLVRKKCSEYEKNNPVLSEAIISQKIIEIIGAKSVLHISNSLPIRLFNCFSIKGKKDIEIYSNRGTSGIDGSVSTAIGSALASKEKQHYLVTGDMSFMYDRNAFWFDELPANLNIIIFNNQGGGIFRSMSGPSSQKELETYFVTKQNLNFENTANQHKCSYICTTNFSDSIKAIEKLFQTNKQSVISILEIRFDYNEDFGLLKILNEYIKQGLNFVKDRVNKGKEAKSVV